MARQEAGQDEAAADDDDTGCPDDEDEECLDDVFCHAFADAGLGDEGRISGGDDRRPAVGRRISEEEAVSVPGHDRLLTVGLLQDPVG